MAQPIFCLENPNSPQNSCVNIPEIISKVKKKKKNLHSSMYVKRSYKNKKSVNLKYEGHVLRVAYFRWTFTSLWSITCFLVSNDDYRCVIFLLHSFHLICNYSLPTMSIFHSWPLNVVSLFTLRRSCEETTYAYEYFCSVIKAINNHSLSTHCDPISEQNISL